MNSSFEQTVEPESANMRLDKYLSSQLPDLSRSAIQRAIKAGAAQVNGKAAQPRTMLREGDAVVFTPPHREPTTLKAEPIPLDILYEDEHLVALNKPAGIVVHPSPGHSDGTLVNALLHHFSQLSGVNDSDRPGIVHRLDAGTSGVMLVAKTDPAHVALARQFEEHTIVKTYLALVEGDARFDSNIVDLPLGRHFKHRQKQAVRIGDGREAQTHYTVLERFGHFHWVQVRPRTGRTHQIRVHLATEGISVLCDATYGRRGAITASELIGKAPYEGEPAVLKRPALHAQSIQFLHPATQKEVSFEAPIPYDIQSALNRLREHASRPGGR